VWATLVSLVAYYGGEKAADAITKYGTLGVAGVVTIVLVGWVALHFGKKRLEKKLD
jgi:membrane protein DedA with SNARE-associated domain